ncbi:MAG TPA: response regulator [Candidatus Marinimicrobia bacterium]|nr:response regulator [Candidatus Neomarinimicrobiota bacterium]
MSKPKTLNVIVIDDDPEMLVSFQTIFENTGFNLVTANSGLKALEIARKQEFHIAFIDLFMPEIDGLDTLKEMKKLNPELIAVMISGFRNEDMLEKALKAGAYDYLYKPLDVQDIFGITLKLAQRLGINNDLELLFS